MVLTSNTTDMPCPSGVKLTCIAHLERQGTLRWFISTRSSGQPGQVLAQYAHLPSDTFPMTILENPKVVVVNSSFNVNTSEAFFNSTLEAKSVWFVDMNISSIQCGSFGEFGSFNSVALIRSTSIVIFCS